MKILFLTNNDITKDLYDWIKEREDYVLLYNNRLSLEFLSQLNPDIIISYNYKYIISEEIIKFVHGDIINLHISLLPWNRGAHPNIWSILEGTPKGVTIHYIDKGIDTGNILLQREVYIDENKETIKSSYEILHKEIKKLFINNWQQIKYRELKSFNQMERGTVHYVKEFNELENIIDTWDMPIREFKNKYKLFIKKEV